jgi:poly [ADP-ribose] polymerase
MAQVIEKRQFVFCSAGINSNKVWQVELYDNGDVKTEWGRIQPGIKLQSKTFPAAGKAFMDSKIREKTKPSSHYNGDCYKEIQTLDAGSVSSTTNSKNVSTTKLKQLATAQIASCPLTTKLVSYFTDVNAHAIYNATGGRITYDTSAGAFKTPLGIVTKANIDAARTKLDSLATYVKNKKLTDPTFVKTLEEYLMLIPQDVGRKFIPSNFLGSQTDLVNQNTLLDGLDSSYAAVIASSTKADGTKVKAEEEKIFNVKMAVLEDKAEFDRIKKFYDGTRKSMHYNVYNKKLVRVYSVDIEHMVKAYDSHGAKMENIWELWHGTKPSNILSILKVGFIIPPESASYVCGRAFGNGVYFSDQSTKSLNYATNMWGGKDEGKYFMFLNDVAMGNYYLAPSSFSGNCKKGYDSTFAKAGNSTVANNEMIVYKTSQIKPKYLCEFSD